ncbi:unnamed protein product [Caenorhabditis bovis]|uniref:Uncharacterized protein n=1 Tax=Caenorhabditis bovis TaxID=2654633 RepID=A0A8S1F8X3_9PELO|nr:unnamed protein product [Caenorhabditis bovis]
MPKNYELISQSICEFRFDTDEKTFNALVVITFKINGDISEIPVKFGKSLEFVKIVHRTQVGEDGGFFYSENASNDAYSYDESSEILSVKFDDLNTRTANAVSMEITIRGKIGNQQTGGPIYIDDDGVLIVDLKNDTHQVFPYLDTVETKFGLTVMVEEGRKFECDGEEPTTYYDDDNIIAYTPIIENNFGLNTLKFKVHPKQ